MISMCRLRQIFLNSTFLLTECNFVRFVVKLSKCQDAVKEVKVLEREALSVIERSFATTSKVLPSQPSEDWPVEVELNVSPD